MYAFGVDGAGNLLGNRFGLNRYPRYLNVVSVGRGNGGAVAVTTTSGSSLAPSMA